MNEDAQRKIGMKGKSHHHLRPVAPALSQCNGFARPALSCSLNRAGDKDEYDIHVYDMSRQIEERLPGLEADSLSLDGNCWWLF